MEENKNYWNPIIAGFILGTALFVSFMVAGQGMGASGAFARSTAQLAFLYDSAIILSLYWVLCPPWIEYAEIFFSNSHFWIKSEIFEIWSSINAFNGYTSKTNTPSIGFSNIFCKIGMMNASVFPEPVGAEIIELFPFNIERIDSFWNGNTPENPYFFKPSMIFTDKTSFRFSTGIFSGSNEINFS